MPSPLWNHPPQGNVPPQAPNGAFPPPPAASQDGFFARQPGPAPAAAAPDGQGPFKSIQSPPQLPLPYDEGEDSFFTPTQGPQAAAPAPGIPVPPPYQGPLAPPAYPPYPGAAGPVGAPQAMPPGMDSLPERVPYQAPPRRRGGIVYLYMALFVLAAIALAIAIPRILAARNQQSLGVVTLSTQDSIYGGSAIIARNESAYTQEGVAMVKYLAEEGSTVRRGDPVCTVYTSGLSNRDLSTLQSYRKQIKEYLRILTSGSEAPDPKLKQLETTVLERVAETQALVRGAHGSLINQEAWMKTALNERYNYLKQKFPDDSKLTRLYDNESSQLQRMETYTKQFAASDHGIVSFYTDGLEGALNTTNFEQYGPQEVRDMIAGRVPKSYQKPKNEADIYRLVRQQEWAVLMLAQNLEWNPVVGEAYQMTIESFDNTIVSARVVSVTRTGGDLLVRLSVNSAVDPVLYIRNCHVKLSTQTSTYAVPRAAILNRNGKTGIVVAFQEGNYFIPVDILSEDSTQAHVVPVYVGYLQEGMQVLLF